MATVQAMSDRRFLVVVIALLAALAGLPMVVLPLLALDDPLVVSGEIGERVDVTSELVASMAIGAVLLLGGLAIAVGLVRHQLRLARPR